jgi:hypothetical protein
MTTKAERDSLYFNTIAILTCVTSTKDLCCAYDEIIRSTCHSPQTHIEFWTNQNYNINYKLNYLIRIDRLNEK